MSEFNQNGSDYDSEGLPPSVRRYLYQGKEHFSQIIKLERERYCLSTHLTEFIIFSINAPTFQRDFLNSTTPIRGILFTFDPTTSTLIVKMLSHGHHQVAKAFDQAIEEVLRPMGLHRAIFTYGEVNIDVAGMTKQPDWGWGPRRPPRGHPKRPTVVLEVAISETRKKLEQDMALWLDPSRGNTNIAIAIKASRARPTVTVDKYEWDHANGRVQNSQHIEVRESAEGDKVTVSGAPLHIPFDLLFLRSPQSPRETDLHIGNEELKEFAQWVWDAQFGQ
ncbi:hypothetical protein N7471_012538 [Penicillium samsonianum]|uniref:uncharacterized protein n=1 Tax=Penicillium samsonianum TaxID=1882272 RepID=UPI002546C0C8|nr:uncharacterized protein N7471_012538 [Penicillium samsonianum]KAJ6125221.1 hypothetical protein N7471_012538 [Penicillium samsonianum]